MLGKGLLIASSQLAVKPIIRDVREWSLPKLLEEISPSNEDEIESFTYLVKHPMVTNTAGLTNE